MQPNSYPRQRGSGGYVVVPRGPLTPLEAVKDSSDAAQLAAENVVAQAELRLEKALREASRVPPQLDHPRPTTYAPAGDRSEGPPGTP